ncbi:DUF1648 domain-containing protein [Nocardioides sp. JQ2195]|uniref:DUF1648 domain-containing protein n=1 Tax=Nocardioides sp. JQ2195 TaxID=2592334 RepID=UPI00143EEBEB|nr:DUF1648 domain-containing protein [Nocardioides sp. JQ2195]QIX28044.1 DUF1648 domain-containing protein [Nocardioides sp. JQ2195]
MIWFFRVSVLAYVVALVVAAFAYPEQVPVHFDATGAGDRFQPRGVAVLSMAGAGLGLAVLLALFIRVFARGSLKHLNIPHKSWWTQPENSDRLRRMLANDLAWIGGCTMTLMTCMLAITIKVADDAKPSMGTFGWVTLFGFLIAVTGQVVFMYTSRYRPENP